LRARSTERAFIFFGAIAEPAGAGPITSHGSGPSSFSALSLGAQVPKLFLDRFN
jgi:hypothetical protein